MSALAPARSEPTLQPAPAEATRLLYERYSGRLFGYCMSLLGSREEAEDAVQTTFLNAQRGLGRGVVPQFELAWLFKIAKNVCNNRRVSASRRGRVELVRDLDTLQDVLASPERGGGVSVGELTRALAGIPERQRRALLLREWQGLSYSEIAAELGVSVAAVETLLFRARRSLAEQLEQTGTTRSRGAVASVVALFRWLFQGGAAPLKIAAVTATVATATLVVAPVVRHHERAPARAKVTPQVGAVSPAPTGHSTRQTVRGDAQPARTPPVAGQTHAPSVSAPSSRGDASLPSKTAQAIDASTPAPVITTPDLVVPDVTSPTDVLPDVSVPQILPLPNVELQADLPPPPSFRSCPRDLTECATEATRPRRGRAGSRNA